MINRSRIFIIIIESIKISIHNGREISAIIVTDDYLCYKEPKSLYDFYFVILLFNELFKFKTPDE